MQQHHKAAIDIIVSSKGEAVVMQATSSKAKDFLKGLSESIATDDEWVFTYHSDSVMDVFTKIDESGLYTLTTG